MSYRRTLRKPLGSSGSRARDLERACSLTRSARAHIARGIAAALLLELDDAKRLGAHAALELHDALEIAGRA